MVLNTVIRILHCKNVLKHHIVLDLGSWLPTWIWKQNFCRVLYRVPGNDDGKTIPLGSWISKSNGLDQILHVEP